MDAVLAPCDVLVLQGRTLDGLLNAMCGRDDVLAQKGAELSRARCCIARQARVLARKGRSRCNDRL